LHQQVIRVLTYRDIAAACCRHRSGSNPLTRFDDS